jgi:ATP-dependent DNA ligase
MTDEERAEIKKLGETDKPQAVKKVMEILNASADEKKNKGVAQLQAACRHLIVDTLGEDAAKDLRTQKESGATTEELSKKVSEMLTGITDEQKKAKALEYKETCEKVYGMASSAPAPVAAQAPTRKIRHAAHHDLEAKLRNEWKWLTGKYKIITHK